MQFLPRDHKFFDLLVDHARMALNASSVLAQGISEGGTEQGRNMASRIRDIERAGDKALRELDRKLHQTFITPLDGEDIHELGSTVDDILDHLDAVAWRIDAYGLNDSPGDLPQIVQMVHGCIESSVAALQSLQKNGVDKPDELTDLCQEINARELATEDRVRVVMRDLFRTERDPIALMKKKEVYDLLEQTGDYCETLADVLESVAVKNS